MTESFSLIQTISAQDNSLDQAANPQEPLLIAGQSREELMYDFDKTGASPSSYLGLQTRSPSTAGAPPGEEASESSAERITEAPLEPVPPAAPAIPDPGCEELYTDISKMIAERTQLSQNVCCLVAFWAVATWFPEAFAVFPCLVLTGDLENASTLLKTLEDVCFKPHLLAGFRKVDLKVFAGLRTLLISDRNLDKRTAALLGCLTNCGFLITDKNKAVPGAGFRAVYIGEKQSKNRIEHSLSVDATSPVLADIPLPMKQASAFVASLRHRLHAYRDRNLSKVESNIFRPAGLSAEPSVIASVLGSSVVDSPSMQQELVTLLQPKNQQALDDRNHSWEALVVGAAIKLTHQANGEIYMKQIVAEIDPQLDTLGENKKGRSEKVGHRLRDLGLRSRRLSDKGNGLRLDPSTKLRLQELGKVYVM